MSYGFLIVSADGSFARKELSALSDGDRLVLDAPDSFKSIEARQGALDMEIAAAGGLEAWMALTSPPVE